MIRPIKQYFVTVYEELNKVVWPTRNQAIRLSIIVIVSVIIAAAIFAVIDTGFLQGVRYILER